MDGHPSNIAEYAREPPAAVSAQLRRIYEASFPAEERVLWEDLISGLGSGGVQLFVAERGDHVVAFGATACIPEAAAHLLEYFAVAPELRNHGEGGALLTAILQRLAGPRADILLGEVERPQDAEGAERRVRERRLRFYERHGALAVKCAPAYRAPNLAGRGTVAYLLFWIPLGKEAAEPIGTRLRYAVSGIFEKGYARTRDDALLRDVLDDLTC